MPDIDHFRDKLLAAREAIQALASPPPPPWCWVSPASAVAKPAGVTTVYHFASKDRPVRVGVTLQTEGRSCYFSTGSTALERLLSRGSLKLSWRYTPLLRWL